MHFLVMSPCSREFLLMSLYIYSNETTMYPCDFTCYVCPQPSSLWSSGFRHQTNPSWSCPCYNWYMTAALRIRHKNCCHHCRYWQTWQRLKVPQIRKSKFNNRHHSGDRYKSNYEVILLKHGLFHILWYLNSQIKGVGINLYYNIKETILKHISD